MPRRAIILVLDGVGIGDATDAAAYDDAGSDTLGNLALSVGGLKLPHLELAGLGRIRPLHGVAEVPHPTGAWGALNPASAGKDSTTGHWELMGLRLERPFPTYPHGFPADIVAQFTERTGRPVLGNVAGSGTDMLDAFGAEHERTGAWILYTSADSVFQLAAHEELVPLEELYRACQIARELLGPPHEVSRVIARPFTGASGRYERTDRRKDFSIPPTGPTLLDALAVAGVPVQGVGKVDDMFAGRGITARHTRDNEEGIRAIHSYLQSMTGGLLLANLVDFDTRWGHRNDPVGFYEGLRAFDRELPALMDALHEDDLLFITADHGNDPTTPSTDHSREKVPLLVLGEPVHPVALGERSTFADVGATAGEWLGVDFRGAGRSFLGEVCPA
jgi:phosphopentomutase